MELRGAYPVFQGRNVEVVAISTDTREEALQMARYAEARYPVIPDPRREIVRRYDVFDLLKDDLSAPATFVVAKDGSIYWQQIGRHIADWPSAQEILRRLPPETGAGGGAR